MRTGTLQVFDILGHQLSSRELPTTNYQLPTANCQLPTPNCQLPTANCQLPTPNFPSDVYVLRLINGENVRTQKIVVE